MEKQNNRETGKGKSIEISFWTIKLSVRGSFENCVREGCFLDPSYPGFSKLEIRGGKFQILMALPGMQRLLWGCFHSSGAPCIHRPLKTCIFFSSCKLARMAWVPSKSRGWGQACHQGPSACTLAPWHHLLHPRHFLQALPASTVSLKCQQKPHYLTFAPTQATKVLQGMCPVPSFVLNTCPKKKKKKTNHTTEVCSPSRA